MYISLLHLCGNSDRQVPLLSCSTEKKTDTERLNNVFKVIVRRQMPKVEFRPRQSVSRMSALNPKVLYTIYSCFLFVCLFWWSTEPGGYKAKTGEVLTFQGQTGRIWCGWSDQARWFWRRAVFGKAGSFEMGDGDQGKTEEILKAIGGSEGRDPPTHQPGPAGWGSHGRWHHQAGWAEVRRPGRAVLPCQLCEQCCCWRNRWRRKGTRWGPVAGVAHLGKGRG